MYQHDEFSVVVSIPQALFFCALGISLTGFLLTKTPHQKKIWLFFGAGELLQAFLLLKLWPCFYDNRAVCLLLFSAATFAIILAGIWFFKALTK